MGYKTHRYKTSAMSKCWLRDFLASTEKKGEGDVNEIRIMLTGERAKNDVAIRIMLTGERTKNDVAIRILLTGERLNQK